VLVFIVQYLPEGATVVSESAMSLPELLARRAAEQPDGLAYRFLDYDVDMQGFAEELTWTEVHQRARLIGDRLREHGSPGDRVAIAAPHGLDYVLGFLGAVQAGFVAVPLPVPHPGALDERFAGVLHDCSPAAVVTTSAAIAETLPYSTARGSGAAVIEVDALDFGATPSGDSPALDPYSAAYLQYTSGSTRAPAGVVVTHHNVISNLDQITNEYRHGVTENRHLVSWLPFYHDMGLILGVLIPIMVGRPAVLMTPMAFLQKPARWLQQLARNTDTFTAGPNFAYDLSVRRVSDDDLAGLDLDGVVGMILGGERVHGATMRRFAERFAAFGLRESALRPSYGLAEATLHVASSAGERAPAVVTFDAERLAAGYLEAGDGVELVSCGAAGSCEVRIVDPDTVAERPAGAVGEIWVHGDQVGAGYWRNPDLTERTFGGRLANPSEGTPPGPWLRTGDLGAIFNDELFVVGRIKDLLIVDGRNHYPDDIEATVEDITNSRAVAVAVPIDTTETLVAIAEVKTTGGAPELRDVKRRIASAIRACHGVRVRDLVLVAPGSLPITTSGKVRRTACRQLYQEGEFVRLDAPV
jgi:long chain fatty acid CoA FadD26